MTLTVEEACSLLGLSKGATAEDKKKAYRRAALNFHPDKNINDPEANAKFQMINEAYRIISDPDYATCSSGFDEYFRSYTQNKTNGELSELSDESSDNEYYVLHHREFPFVVPSRIFDESCFDEFFSGLSDAHFGSDISTAMYGMLKDMLRDQTMPKTRCATRRGTFCSVSNIDSESDEEIHWPTSMPHLHKSAFGNKPKPKYHLPKYKVMKPRKKSNSEEKEVIYKVMEVSKKEQDPISRKSSSPKKDKNPHSKVDFSNGCQNHFEENVKQNYKKNPQKDIMRSKEDDQLPQTSSVSCNSTEPLKRDIRAENSDFGVGTSVLVFGKYEGRIAYEGEVHYAKGQWLGVDLVERVEKNDGVVKGVRYFTCEKKHGWMVRPHDVVAASSL